jgi:hypothetical protein
MGHPPRASAFAINPSVSNGRASASLVQSGHFDEELWRGRSPNCGERFQDCDGTELNPVRCDFTVFRRLGAGSGCAMSLQACGGSWCRAAGGSAAMAAGRLRRASEPPIAADQA